MSDDLTEVIRALVVELAPPTCPPSRLRLTTLLLTSQVLHARNHARNVEPILRRIPAAHPSTPKQAVEQLSRFGKALDALNDATRGLSATAHAEIESAREALTGTRFPSVGLLLLYLADQYPELTEAARSAIRNIQDGDTGPRPGRPRKEAAYRITCNLAGIYKLLTGKRPTIGVKESETRAYGRFLELVRGIFALAEIDASAEAQARKAIKALPASAVNEGNDWPTEFKDEIR